MESILGRKRTGFHLEFLQRIGKRKRQSVVGVDIVVKSAVKRVGVSTKEAAGNGKPCRVRIYASRVRVGRGQRHCRAGKRYEIGNLAADQRKLENSRVF